MLNKHYTSITFQLKHQSTLFLFYNNLHFSLKYSSQRNVINFKKYTTKVSDNVEVSFAPKFMCENVEQGKYEKWERTGYSHNLDSNSVTTKGVFSLILPPPNVTGNLHLGHALNITIQDILCRWKRMQGNTVLWIPGTDHAGIATQVAVEKMLFSQYGLLRQNISEEEFMQHISKWKDEKIKEIRNQVKRLGASLDWSQEIFTMDAVRSNIVTDALIQLFDDGMLYRDNTIINWCCHLRSAISDIEVEHISIDGSTHLSVPNYNEPITFGQLIKFVFKVFDSDREVVVSTTRLETAFGDVAIAVHPSDARYSDLRNSYVWHPFRNCKIPIIFDKNIDPNFGTGAVKITPAHSTIDFNIAKSHDLPIIPVINEDGLLGEHCGKYSGMKRFLARQAMIDELCSLRLLRSIDDYPMKVPLCSRSRDIVEYVLKPQWFLKCHDLAKKANEVVLNSELYITWEAQRRIWLAWHDNLRDWCISRQLYWGHRLPLYETSAGWIAARSPQEARSKAALKLSVTESEIGNVVQENSVVDTWFSSALLPFSVFEGPTENETMKVFYPLSLVQTGQDILCFWVSRMVMMGIYFTGKVPFKVVSLHGMVCDAKGRKMSKSLGNVILPEDVMNGLTLKKLNKRIYENHKLGLLSDTELKRALLVQKDMFPDGIPKCGTDALRFTLASVRIKDQAINFSVYYCNRYFAFCNKIWQASKFIIGWANSLKLENHTSVTPSLLWHWWILSRLSYTVKEVNDAFDSFDFQLAVITLYNFFVNDLCDAAVELSKPVLLERSSNSDVSSMVLLHCLETTLRLIAPMMPFITEELYSYLPLFMTDGKSVHATMFPDASEYAKWKNEIIESEMSIARDIISCIRSLKAKVKAFSKNVADVTIVSDHDKSLRNYLEIIQTLTRCNSVKFSETPDKYTLVDTIENHTRVYIFLPLTEKQWNDYIRDMNSKVERLRSRLNKLLFQESNGDGENRDSTKNSEHKINCLVQEIDELEVYLNEIRNRRIS